MADENPQGGENKAEALQKLLDKNNGDAMRTLGILFSENFDLREKNRKLKEQVPGADTIALKKEDADRLAAFDALGVKPEDAKKKLDGVTTLETENAGLKRAETLRNIAAAGYSYDALKDFDALEPGLEYEVKDETKDGKAVRSVVVKVDGKERPLDEYAKEKRPALASVLKAEGQQQQGVQYVNQSAGDKKPTGNLYDDIRNEAKTREEAQKKEGMPLTERKGLTVIGTQA